MTITWVDVDTNPLTTLHEATAQGDILVEVRSGSVDHLYCFYISAANVLQWKKSIDGGANWTGPTTIDGTQTWTNVSVWFDRWTPDDTTGNTIHILATNTDLDLATYFSLGIDDDLAETNNDVDIVASPGALSARTNPSICKAKDGDIYVSWQVSATAVGAHIYRSGDSGATWGSIYGRTEWDIDATGSTDQLRLMPLETDDDILCVWIDDSGNKILSIRYDGTATDATGWDASVVEIDNFQYESDPGEFCLFDCAVDDNGDIYLVWMSGTTLSAAADIFFNVYDESASTWGTETVVYRALPTGGVNVFELMSMHLCYDKIDGAIFCSILAGEGSQNTVRFITQSYDSGVSWGEMVSVANGSVGIDDWRSFHLPKAILHTDNKLCMVAFNDDLNDLESLSGGIVLLRKTGIVKDDAGVAVTTCDCLFFRVQTSSHEDDVTKHIYLGKINSDGSGNWSVPLVDHHNDTPEFQVLYDDDLANDETDASRRFST